MIQRIIRQREISTSDCLLVRRRLRIQAGRRQRLQAIVLIFWLAYPLCGQTASTGALIGVTMDPSGAVLGDVTVRINRVDTSESQSVISGRDGRFGFLLLQAGTYALQAEKANFKPLDIAKINVHVTETLRMDLRLELAVRFERAQVSSTSSMVQLDSSALGRVVNGRAISSLPMVNRNYTQITGLSPGVTVGVYNAGELGTGATALSQLGRSNDGVYVHGSHSFDNNWQLDGLSVSDVQGSGAISGGIPIPNPDALQEFKLQTGLYDAAFGRGAGADVSVITKSGSDEYHGTVFEFLRNNILNANDFFLKQTGHPRPDLKQNQLGFTLGGPLRKDKLLAFVSYQGTRQINGAAANQSRIACTATLNEPPLTNDRSSQALGQLFGGMTGANGGVGVNSDGSNINPVSLALLNFRLPDGSLLIPTPQTINPAKAFSAEGFSAFTQPCEFSEDQGLANLSYVISQMNQLTARLFVAESNQSVTFPGGAFNPTGNIRGFDSPGNSEFLVFSVADTYVLRSDLLNEARLGFVRTTTSMDAHAPFQWSDVGVSESNMNSANELPSLSILGSLNMSSVFPRTYSQTSFVGSDVFSWLHGDHALKFGGAVTRLEDDLEFAGTGAYLEFLSWPDFLLGLDGNGNGTNTFSNVFQSSDLFGLLNRKFISREGSAFMQDDYRLSRALTLNAGVRYERIGQFGDALGRNASFDVTKADSDPPSQGTLDGFIVASNFPGALPAGVIRGNNTYGTYGKGQDAVAPRLGFAWKVLPRTSRLVLRAGYGIFFSRPTGQASTVGVLAAPFGLSRAKIGTTNVNATFQAPFAQPFPTTESFPLFLPYSPTTAASVNAVAPGFPAGVSPAIFTERTVRATSGLVVRGGIRGCTGNTSATLPFAQPSARCDARESCQTNDLEHAGECRIASADSRNTLRWSSGDGI